MPFACHHSWALRSLLALRVVYGMLAANARPPPRRPSSSSTASAAPPARQWVTHAPQMQGPSARAAEPTAPPRSRRTRRGTVRARRGSRSPRDAVESAPIPILRRPLGPAARAEAQSGRAAAHARLATPGRVRRSPCHPRAVAHARLACLAPPGRSGVALDTWVNVLIVPLLTTIAPLPRAAPASRSRSSRRTSSRASRG
jgi:hypothetical protein